MKKYISTLSLLFITLNSFSSFAQEEFKVDGVTLPRFLEFQTKKIQLNGSGTRSKYWMDMYVNALYLTDISHDPKAILASNTLMAVRIEIKSSLVTSEKFSKLVTKGLVKSVGQENLYRYEKQIDMLAKMISSQKTQKKDCFNLFYNPTDSNLWVYKNDVLYGKIPGLDFKKALFGIWLSDDPINADLKNDLLGN
jgi:Chalcone isomerase-like